MSPQNVADDPRPTPADLERRVAISKDFDMMQGLIPMGVGLGTVVAGLLGQPLVMALVAGLSTSIGESWYKKRYGAWRARLSRNVAGFAVAVIATAVVLVAVLADHFRWASTPIWWTSFVSAAGLALGCYLGLRHVGLTVWHWLTFALLALSALVPLSGLRFGGWGMLLPLGIALIAVGAIDHRRLVSGIGPGVRDE